MAISQGSWELNGTNLRYVSSSGTVIATVSGLKTTAATDGNINLDRETGVITVYADALDSKNVSLSVGSGVSPSCTLKLASDVSGVSIDTSTVALTSESKNGKAYVKGTLTAGYTLAANSKSITYAAAKENQTLATITGLVKDSTGATEYDAADEGDTPAVSVNATTGKVTLSSAALTTGNVTLANSNGGAYTLALSSDENTDPDADGKIGFEQSEPYWAVNRGTATYKINTALGYTLAENGLSLAYKAAVNGTTIATITGLNTAATVDTTGGGEPDNSVIGTITDEAFTNGIDVTVTGTAYKFELNPNILATTKGTVAITSGTGYTGTLELDITVPQEATNKNIWTISNGTATYKNIDTVYYTLKDGKVTCTPQTAGTTLATVSGLSAAAAWEGEEPNVIANDNTNTITLNAAALNAKNVTLTLPKNYTTAYTLALGEDVQGLEFSDKALTAAVNKSGLTTGNVTVKAAVTSGYLPTTAGTSVIYRAQAAAKNLDDDGREVIATIKGIASGKDPEIVNSGITIDLDEMDEYGNIIVSLDENALGTSNVSVSATGTGASYTLNLDTDNALDDTDTAVKNGVNVWRISGTTATYKKVIPAYYTYDTTKNQIVYHKETDVETYAVVKGINKDLKVIDEYTFTSGESGDVKDITSKIVMVDPDNENGGYYTDAEENLVEFIKLDTQKNVITLNKEALTTTSVTFDTAKTGSAYTLALNTAETDDNGDTVVYAPQIADTPNFNWSVDSGKVTKTATLKGAMTEGWTVASNGKTITYTKAGTATIATVSGLSKDVKTQKNNDSTSDNYKNLELGATVDGTFVNGVTGYEDGEGNKVITLKNELLTSSDVVISSNYGFTLNIDDDVLSKSEATTASDEGKRKLWQFDSTTGTATYGVYIPAYYDVDSNGNITYTAAELNKTLATVTGLNPDLVAGTGTYEKSLGVYDSEGTFTAYVTMTEDNNSPDVAKGTVEFISDKALNEQNVVLTGNGYKFATIDSNSGIEEPDNKYSLKFEGSTTIDLQKGTSAGYTLYPTTKTLEYTKEVSGTKVAQVKGIKSGLTIYSVDDKYTDENGNTIIVESPFLGVEKTKTEETTNETTGRTTTTTLKYVEPVLYLGAIENATKTDSVEGNLAILLTSGALAQNSVTLTNVSGNYYQLSLVNGEIDTENGAEIIPDSDYSTAWKTKGTTATLVGYTPESWKEVTSTSTYTMVDDETKGITSVKTSVTDYVTSIQYSAASQNSELATLTGLNSKNLTVGSNGQIDGIAVTGDASEGYTITIDNKHLNSTDVTVTPKDSTSGVTYTLALGEDVTVSTKGGGTWTNSGNTYTYTENVDQAGYAVENGNIVYRAGNITSKITNLTEAPSVSTDDDGNTIFVIDSSIIKSNKGVPQTVTLTTGKYNSNYHLEAGDGIDEVVTNYVWKKTEKDAKATYNKVESGYTVAENQKSISYSNNKTTVLATISGLVKAGVAATAYEIDDDEDGTADRIANNELDGITLTYDEDGAGTFTLDKSVLGQNNVTLATTGNYSLYIDPEYCAVDTISPEVRKNKGTASIVEGTTQGWTLTNAKTITYAKEKTTTLATITGLPTTTESLSSAAFDASNRVITLGYEDLKGGGSKILLKDGTSKGYTLALQQTEDVVPTQYESPKWTYKSGKATLQDGTTEGWELSNTKQISKVAANLTNVATVSGLGKAVLYPDDDGNLYLTRDEITDTIENEDGTTTDVVTYKYSDKVLSFTEAEYDSNGNLIKKGVITVNQDLLDAGKDSLITENKVVTKSGVKSLTLGAKDNYVFAFAEGVNIPEQESTPAWVATANGTIEYQVAMDDGWTLTDKAITYSAATTEAKPKVLAKITGLTGIAKGTDVSDLVTIDEDAKTIKLTDAALEGITKNGAKVTLTSDDYTLTIDDSQKPKALDEPKWSIKGTTATLKEGTSEGFTLAANGKTLTYSAETTDATVATITGLKSGLKMNADGTINVTVNRETNTIPGISVYYGTNEIALTSDVLGTTNVVLTSDDYTFDDSNAFINSIKSGSGDKLWTAKSGTATLKQDIYSGFDLSTDKKTFTYVKPETKTLVTITGLNTAYNYDSDPSGIEFNEDTGRITLNSAALGNKKVAIKEKNSTYSLVLGEEVNSSKQNVTEWVTSGTTAVLKNYDKAWYKLNTSTATGTIEYNAESKPYHTYATITGLAKGATISDSNVSDHVITLNSSQVGTSNITLKDGEDTGYTLAFGPSVTPTQHDVEGSSDDDKDESNYNSTGKIASKKHGYGWAVVNGTATLMGTITAGFTLAANGKSATYLKADKYNQTFAKVTGLNTELTSTSESSPITADDYGVITIDKSMLTGKNVALTNSNGSTYKLALATSGDNKVEASKVVDEAFDNNDGITWDKDTNVPAWTTKGTTATLKGVVSAGYKQTSDTAITYTKATGSTNKKVTEDGTTTTIKVYNPQTLATVAGLATGASIEADANADADDTTIELKQEQLTSKVTINGTGYYDFNFASDYNNSSIVGSANADSITVGGTGLTVQLGKGNDYVDFDGHGNTFLYANGDGNDVIADFTVGNDKLKITSGTVTSVTTDGNDAVVKVGSGTITLKGRAGESIIVYDKNNAVKTYQTGSADLLDSDNFLTDSSELDSLVNSSNFLGDYSATQDLTNSDLTTLTKQSSLITYGNDKDK